MSLSKSCLRCVNFLTCNDKRKSATFRCERFLQLKNVDSLADLFDIPLEPTQPKHQRGVIPIVTSTDIPEGLPIEDEEDENGEKVLFVLEAMRKSYDPLTNTATDVTLDTSDLTLAPNFYHFCKYTVGDKIKMPFARQLWIGYRFFAEWCPRCSDPAYNEITKIEVDADPEEVLDHVTLLTNGRCPKCSVSKSQLILGGEINDYNELDLVLGQRSGKSTLLSLMAAYHVHRLLKVPRLSSICNGIQDFTPIQGTFVGLSFARAKKLLWSPFTSIIERSTWFQMYHQVLDAHKARYGKELYRQSSEFLRYNHQNIEFYPAGPMKRTLRGDTRCMALIDELGWFPFDLNKDSEQMDDEEDERERANADEVHASLSNSLATIRTEMWNLYDRDINHIPGGIMLNASSPASWKDKICRLLKDAEGSKFMLGLRMPTWDINPIFTRDHPIITEAYRKNPVKADRDFGANPPSLSSSVYSKNAIQRLFTGHQHHALAVEVSDPIIPGEDKKVFGRAVIKHHKNMWPASVLALDAGLSNNAFSGVLAFLQDQVMVAATLFEVVPTGGRKIHFPSMMKFVINPIIEQCNVHYVFADRWNSVLLLQQIPVDYPKVLSAQYTLKGKDFDSFNSDFIETGNLVLPKLELPTEQIETVTNYKQELNGYPSSHLYLQFLTVRELQGVITKGDGYTDDIYRALVLAAARIRDPKVTEHLRKFAPVERVMGDFSNRLLISGRSGLDFSRMNDLIK